MSSISGGFNWYTQVPCPSPHMAQLLQQKIPHVTLTEPNVFPQGRPETKQGALGVLTVCSFAVCPSPAALAQDHCGELGLASLRKERVSLLPQLKSLSLSSKQFAVSYWAGGKQSL